MVARFRVDVVLQQYNRWTRERPGCSYRGVRGEGEQDEMSQTAEWRRLALSWISAHPSKAAIGWVRDVGLFFSYPDPYIRDWYTLHGWRPPRLDERVIYPLVFIAAVLALAYRRRWGEIWLLVIVAGYFVGFFSVFLPLARYRMPLLPFLAIFAAGVPEMLIGLSTHDQAQLDEFEDSHLFFSPEADEPLFE